MRTTVGFALGALGILGLAWACGGKQLGSADGGLGDSGTEDAVGTEDVFEAATQDVASEDDGFGAGDEAGSGDGCGGCIDGSSSEDDSGFGSDASEGGFDGGITCTPEGGSIGTGGEGGCSASFTENCNNGFSYSVDCDCPAAMCSCSASSSTSGSGFMASYKGCGSSCGNAILAWEACGFPLPP